MSVQVMKQMTMVDLRTVLSEQIELIRKGKSTASNVNAISNATGKILSTIKLELEYHKLIGKAPNLSAMLGDGSDITPAVNATTNGSPTKKRAK
jgi:hypothetical protein